VHGARIRPAAVAVLLGALVLGSLVVTPTAGAAITASQITAPTDPSFLVADQTAAKQTFAISGTTSGGSPASEKVDVRCYYHATSALVAKNVALSSDGSFSIPAADLNKVIDLTCRLRAVPAGTNPFDLTPYSGPLIGVGERDSSTVGGGPNNGKLYDYYLDAPQQSAAFDYASLGSCGVHDGFLLDSIYALTTTTFYCNAALLEGEKGTASTRSELQIDGTNAYTPAAAQAINANASGLPALSYSYTVDAATGNLVLHETDPLVRCTTAAYPPTTTSCASFATAGVTDNRIITQDHDGHVSWIADTFTSSDGHAHSLDLLWDNSQHFRGGSGNSSQVEYEFPGQTSFSTHAAGDMVSPATSSPATIFVRMHGASDGDFSTGQGAIVYDRPAAGAMFTSVSSAASEFTLHQTGTVPAGGSTRFRFAYVQDTQAGNVASLAQAASTAFLNTIAVSKSGKGRGKVTSSPGGILCGKTCSHGYAYGAAVTLRAVPAKGSRFVGWSGPCRGHGFCTVTADANATVKATFALRRCVVPNVVGKTLKAARRALTRAYCSVGKVASVASPKVKRGHVISQKPGRGRRLKAHARVALAVSSG
jgi:List-Bact-rpt repeat protein/PASTA domain-containing protein